MYDQKHNCQLEILKIFAEVVDSDDEQNDVEEKRTKVKTDPMKSLFSKVKEFNRLQRLKTSRS